MDQTSQEFIDSIQDNKDGIQNGCNINEKRIYIGGTFSGGCDTRNTYRHKK